MARFVVDDVLPLIWLRILLEAACWFHPILVLCSKRRPPPLGLGRRCDDVPVHLLLPRPLPPAVLRRARWLPLDPARTQARASSDPTAHQVAEIRDNESRWQAAPGEGFLQAFCVH